MPEGCSSVQPGVFEYYSVGLWGGSFPGSNRHYMGVLRGANHFCRLAPLPAISQSQPEG